MLPIPSPSYSSREAFSVSFVELRAFGPGLLLMRSRPLEYVQVKPILAAVTLILKATGTYKEGELSWTAGYLYISFIYNVSICTRWVIRFPRLGRKSCARTLAAYVALRRFALL